MTLNEEAFLEKLTLRYEHLGIPKPRDGRNLLARNPEGQKWGSRHVGSIEGMCFHQAMGGSLSGIAKYHTGPKSHLKAGGVESIAYTFAIEPDGRIVLCNDFNKRPWSQGFRGRAGDENADFISTLVVGDFTAGDHKAGEPTTEQLMSGLILWDFSNTGLNCPN